MESWSPRKFIALFKIEGPEPYAAGCVFTLAPVESAYKKFFGMVTGCWYCLQKSIQEPVSGNSLGDPKRNPHQAVQHVIFLGLGNESYRRV